RRHTRFSRDWSSDVCSSDLGTEPSPEMEVFHQNPDMFARFILDQGKFLMRITQTKKESGMLKKCVFTARATYNVSERKIQISNRSEERRGGKENRARWSTYH